MPLALIDHHCHGVVTADLDQAGFGALLTESPWPPPPGTSAFDGQLGFAVRRWCAPVLGLPPSAPPEDYLHRRAELGAAEVNRRLLTGAGVTSWLVDTGYRASQLADPVELARLSGTPARPVVRLEPVAEQVAAAGTDAAGFAAAFAVALQAAVAGRDRGTGAVGLKSIAAYRFGLDFDPARPDATAVAAAAGDWLRTIEAGTAPRLADPVLLRHVIWTGVDLGLPLQFHTGFGDPDARL